MSKIFASLTNSSCCIGTCVATTAWPPDWVQSCLRRQRFHRGWEACAVCGPRCCLPQLLQLLARAVAPHADIMNDALGLFLPVPELVLLAAAEVNLIVGELAAGEWLAVGRRRLQISGLAYAVPEPVVGIGRDLLAEHFRMEVSIEEELKIVQVILPVVTVLQQVLHQRYARGRVFPPVVPGVAGPIQNVGVMPLCTEVVDTQAVVVVPRNECEIGGVHEVVLSTQPPGVV